MKGQLPPELRALIVRQLGTALAKAWLRQQAQEETRQPGEPAAA